MKKILFLDIDAVLNTKYWYKQMDKNSPKDKYGYMFDPNSVCNLAKILDRTGADIVISSSWKQIGFSELLNMWKERNLPGKIIDVIPDYMCDELLLSSELSDGDCYFERGCEIKGWLLKHKCEGILYVIIDDMDDILLEQQSHFVQTDPEVGISDWDATKSIMILNRDNQNVAT